MDINQLSDEAQRCRDEDARTILQYCASHGWYIAAAESLTAGLLADAFVRIPGASEVFLGSAVTYDIAAKSGILGVDKSVLDCFGAVCEPVARQMAIGTARLYSNESHGVQREGRVIGLSTTGVAGPGPDGDKPAGAVYFGCAFPLEDTYITYVRYCQLHGNREEVRHGVVSVVLHTLREILQTNKLT